MGEEMVTLGIKVPVALLARVDQERLAWGSLHPTRSQVARSLLITALALIDAGIVPRNPDGLQGLQREIALTPLKPTLGGAQLLLPGHGGAERKSA